MVDARRSRVRALHDHARQHGRERRAALDPGGPRTSTLSELEWIVTGYALTFAALMLIGGKLADMLGRRLIFVIGIVIFTLASLCVRSRGHRRDADRARASSRAPAPR